MESRIEITLLKEKDAEQVSDLIQENLMKVNIQHYSRKEMEYLSRQYTPQKILASIENKIENKMCFVARQKENLIATACFTIFRQKREGWISAVFVRKDWQGKGIGRVLLNYLEERAKEENLNCLFLDSSITARDFYLSNGYEMICPEMTKERVYKMQKKIMKNEP